MAKGRVTDTTGNTAVDRVDRQRSSGPRGKRTSKTGITKGNGLYDPSTDPRNKAIQSGNGKWEWAGVTVAPREDHGQQGNKFPKKLRKIKKSLESRRDNYKKDDSGFTRPGSMNVRKTGYVKTGR